jgi:ABC-2 type transport system permease protein
MQPFLTQLFDLILLQLTNWRWSWRGAIITGTIGPVFAMISFGIFAQRDSSATAYILTGNMVLSLLLDGLGKVSSNIAFMKFNGTLDYFATLPVYRSALVLATVIAFFLLSLPAVLVTMIVGSLVLHVPLQLSPWALVVIPLICVSLSGLGAIIGVYARTPEETGSLSLIASLFLFSFGPVLLPLDRLPEIVGTLSLLSPATYAASALRQVVLNMPDRIPLAVDLLVLAGVTVGLLWIVNNRLDWRGRA